MRRELATVTVTLGLLAGLLVNCSGKSEADKAGESGKVQVAQKSIEQVQADHTSAWMKIPGVVGTAIGECNGKPCIKILADSLTSAIKTQIPKAIDGYPIEIEVTGEFRAN